MGRGSNNFRRIKGGETSCQCGGMASVDSPSHTNDMIVEFAACLTYSCQGICQRLTTQINKHNDLMWRITHSERPDNSLCPISRHRYLCSILPLSVCHQLDSFWQARTGKFPHAIQHFVFLTHSHSKILWPTRSRFPLQRTLPQHLLIASACYQRPTASMTE